MDDESSKSLVDDSAIPTEVDNCDHSSQNTCAVNSQISFGTNNQDVDLQSPQDITIAARVESIEGPPPGAGGPHRIPRPKQ